VNAILSDVTLLSSMCPAHRLTQMQMNVQRGGRLGLYPMQFAGNGCQLITAERRARKGQLSAGIEDFAGEAPNPAAKK